MIADCSTPGPLNGDVPRELAKVVIPDYIIEPPGILLVEATDLHGIGSFDIWTASL